MKITGHEITIEPTDRPQVIGTALHEGTRRRYESDKAWLGGHNAANAEEAIRDGYGMYGDEMHRPDGEATIFMAPPQLELSLVAYGVKRLTEGGAGAEEEVRHVDEALLALDAALGRKRQD